MYKKTIKRAARALMERIAERFCQQLGISKQFFLERLDTLKPVSPHTTFVLTPTERTPVEYLELHISGIETPLGNLSVAHPLKDKGPGLEFT